MSDYNKVICKECGWTGRNSSLLVAKHPFNSEWTCAGCPKCQHIDSFATACDEPNCWQPVSCGQMTPAGYRSVCGEHYRQLIQAERTAPA